MSRACLPALLQSLAKMIIHISLDSMITLHHPRSPGTAIMLSANVSLCLIRALRRQVCNRLSPKGAPLASRPPHQVKDAEANLWRRLRLSLFPNRSGSTSLGTCPHLGWNLRCDQGAASGFVHSLRCSPHMPLSPLLPPFCPSLTRALWCARSHYLRLNRT